MVQKVTASPNKKMNTFSIQQQEPVIGTVYEVKTSKDRPKIKGCKKPVWYFFEEKVFELKCSDGRLFFIGRK